MKDLHHDHLGKIQIHISIFHGLKQCLDISICKMPVGVNIKSCMNFAKANFFARNAAYISKLQTPFSTKI